MSHSANFPIHLHRNCENYSSLFDFSGRTSKYNTLLMIQTSMTWVRSNTSFQAKKPAPSRRSSWSSKNAVFMASLMAKKATWIQRPAVRPTERQRCNKRGGARIQEQTFLAKPIQAHLASTAMLNRECFLLNAVRHLDFMITKIMDDELGSGLPEKIPILLTTFLFRT